MRRLPRHEVAAIAEQERADVVREHDGGHAVELGVDHVIGRAEQDSARVGFGVAIAVGSLRAVPENVLS